MLGAGEDGMASSTGGGGGVILSAVWASVPVDICVPFDEEDIAGSILSSCS